MSCDGLTPAWLAALSRTPQSARDLAVTLGQSTSPGNVTAIRATLEQMERKGLVQRTRRGPGAPWVWRVTGERLTVADDPYVREIGRIVDADRSTLTIGVCGAEVTVTAAGWAAHGMHLTPSLAEDLAQLLVSACWQAGWHQGHASRDGVP